MLSNIGALVYFLVLSVVFFIYYRRKKVIKRRGLPLPPGPKGIPVIGNIFDLPTDASQWCTVDKWFKQYGDIIHVSLLGQPVVFLGSLEATSALFEKKSAIYSDRPVTTMINELMGWDFFLPAMRYGTRWREYRRVIHGKLHAGVISRYQSVHQRYARRLLHNLLEEPQGCLGHLRHAFTAIIIAVTYDIDVSSHKDPYIVVAEKAMDSVSKASVPGAFMVNNFPILKYVPKWFPGAGFQKKALEWKYYTEEMIHMPMEFVKEKIRDGTARPSIVANMLNELPQSQCNQHESATMDIGATLYGAGADTSASTAQLFVLAMAMHPEIQLRAQAEIDGIVGQDRLPDYNDRNSLPYVIAILKELSRWQPVFPLSIPHATVADDEFQGYFIPKGTVVIGNSWTILHDPVHYPDPEQFKPERFLTGDGQLNSMIQDPSIAAFGYGRRICPGRHFSDQTLFLIISCILATFDITPRIGVDGKPEVLKPDMLSGLISHPAPFDCSIKPRSSAAAELIRRSLDDSVY